MLDVVGVEALDVDGTIVAGPVVGAPELVVPVELVDGVGGVPLPVVVAVVPDWSSPVDGSVVDVVVVDLPLVVPVWSEEPLDVPVPSVLDDVRSRQWCPWRVVEGDCAGSVMWPAVVCW